MMTFPWNGGGYIRDMTAKWSVVLHWMREEDERGDIARIDNRGDQSSLKAQIMKCEIVARTR